jgi:hypothetical protein
VEILDNIPVDVDVDTLLTHAHISPESRFGQELQALIADIRPDIKPKALYKEAYLQAKHETAVEIDGIRFTSRVLRVNLDQVERAFPFIATCGTEVEERSASYHDVLYRYVLDDLKQRVLRQAVAYLRDHIRNTHAPGPLSAMNPGSLEDWPLREQQQLFALFGDVHSAIGVQLNESFLMHPVKSVSGILFPTEVTFENCQLCPREGCPGRRAPHDEELWRTRYAINS